MQVSRLKKERFGALFDGIRLKKNYFLLHFAVSLGILSSSLFFVIALCYPAPFFKLSNVGGLIFLILLVDLICGPCLTFYFLSRRPRKKNELLFDCFFIITIQIIIFGYGLYSLVQARPVWIAYEGDRFRVVSVPDIEINQINQAPVELQNLSYFGPKMLGVRLLDSKDSRYRESIMLSLEGIHPSFRPERWMKYERQITEISNSLKPLNHLRFRELEEVGLIEKIKLSGLNFDDFGYLPLQGEFNNDWILVLNKNNVRPFAYLEINGWND